MFHVDTSIAVEHYQHPEKDPPPLNVRPLIQTTPDGAGEAIAVSLSGEGFMVIQRAKVGSSILAANGKPRIEVLDTVTFRLDVLARRIMDEVLDPETQAALADADAKRKPNGLKLV